ncbi:MAG: DUF1592 domain-containing protein [Acidobacteriia bacterium]|nr:DUF1592 domain-containing protein [Terriglobia bacterium]
MRIIVSMLALAATAAYAQTTPSFFTDKVYPLLEAARCRACHARDGVASATRLHFPEQDASSSHIQAFGLSLAGLVDRATPSNSLLLAKPSNRVRHTGGPLVRPGSEEEKLLAQWVLYLARAAPESLAPAQPERTAGPTQLVRRLTHSQYNNTVRDLLGDYSKPAQRFPAEDYVDGFKNQLRHQGMPPLLVETYSAAAERLAQNAFRAGDVNKLIPCAPAAVSDASCRDQFLKAFGKRAFRRPLHDAEMARYAAAFTAQAQTTGKFLEGARVVVEAMLQSPKFLFHTESGPGARSNGYAAASRLSYLLWDTMPDRELLESAERGDLLTASGRERAARRMLDSPMAAQALDEFFNQWLRLERVANASKEGRRFPEFTPEMAAAMVEETRRLLHHLVWSDRSFMELFTASYGFLSADLAALYGFPAPPGQFDLLAFPAGARRAGLLGHASILTANAGPLETSPTARGIFVREQLLCQHVPPPPPNVNSNLPEATKEKPLGRRQRLAAHVENAACSSCHRLMDPIGLGLESFDAIGRWREKETLQIENRKIELPLEVAGEIAGLANSEFNDAAGLGRILAATPGCQECIVRQLFRYAFGRTDTAADQPAIQSLTASFRASGFRLKELLVGLARSPELVRGFVHNESER